MTTIDVPSGALAFLDLDLLPEETIESLRASRALTVQFHNPRTYRVYTTRDGFEVRVVGKRAFLKRATRHLALAAGVALVGGTLLFRVPDYTTPPVQYVTTTGETIRLQGDHATVFGRPAPDPAHAPRVVEAVVPPSVRTPATAPSRAAERRSPASKSSPGPRTPALPSQAAERATEAVREAPPRVAVEVGAKPVPATTSTPRPSVTVEAELPLVGGLGLGLGG